MIKTLREVLWFFNGSERIRRRLNRLGDQLLHMERESLGILAELKSRLLPKAAGQPDPISDLTRSLGGLAAEIEDLGADLSRSLAALAARVEELSATLTGEGADGTHAGAGGRRPALAANTGPLSRPRWSEPNYTEPRVLVAVRDLCRSGDTAFDVGANFGGIAVGMSRRVGPKGAVCAFEANPAVAARCQEVLIANGCGNVQVYDGAIYRNSNEEVSLYLSENQVSDSIYHQGSGQSISVRTIALDDFVESTGLVPNFVKMDIEGAEHDALLGFVRTIREHRPIMVLEQTLGDQRCLTMLTELGYEALDLSTYEKVRSFEDLPPETVITDILYAHAGWFETSDYKPGTTDVATLSATDFSGDTPNFLRSRSLVLPMGRYVVKASYRSETSEKQEMLCGIWSDKRGEPVMQHHGHSDSLSILAHRWVFDAPPDEISVFFRFPQQRPESFSIEQVTISAVDSLQKRPLIF